MELMDMEYSTFNQTPNDALKEPMFFGQSVNVSRFDEQRYPTIEKLIERQLSQFWRPEEIDISRDRSDFASLPAHEQHIFVSNLKYQTLLDSIQGRAPNMAFLPLVSLPCLENFVETWSFFETIHSRSYTHIIRNIFNDPSAVLDDIVINEEILKRASDISKYYDKLIELSQLYNLFGDSVHTISGRKVVVNARELKKALYLCMVSVNVLEGVRFYVSFACTFAFAERRYLEGNAKIVRLIARDEILHLYGTQFMLNNMALGKDDPEMSLVAKECEEEVYSIFLTAANQEKDWAKYLFKDGTMIGLNEDILCQYVEFITNERMKAINLKPAYQESTNPLPWMKNWLESDAVQVAPQEVEVSSYLVGQIDSTVDEDQFSKFDL